MHFSDWSDGEMKRALLLIKMPPVQSFAIHKPENVVKVFAIYQLQSKEVGTKLTQLHACLTGEYSISCTMH